MDSPYHFAVGLTYLAAWALYLWVLSGAKRVVGRIATALLVGGLGIHYLSLLQRARELDSVPYQDLYGSMSLFAWLLALTYLGLELFHRQRSVGAFVLPFVLVLVVIASVSAPEGPGAPAPARGALFALHVTSNILAYSAFAISFVLSVIFLLQNRMLLARKPGTVFWRFPALEVLDQMSRSSVVVGVIALTFGMALGLEASHRIRGTYWSNDPKEIVSLVVLVCYAVYLWLGRTASWRGARASKACIFNFGVVVFSYTVVNLYLSSYHRYF